MIQPANVMTSAKVSFDLVGLFDFLEDVLAWVKDRDGRYVWENRAFLLNYALQHPSLDEEICARQVLGKTDHHGYTSYELCHQLPVVNGETVGIEFAHKNARLAVEFMREIIKAEYRQQPAKPAAPEPVGAA